MSDMSSTAGQPLNGPEPGQEIKGRSLWSDARARLMRNRAAVVSLVLLTLIAIASIFGALSEPARARRDLLVTISPRPPTSMPDSTSEPTPTAGIFW